MGSGRGEAEQQVADGPQPLLGQVTCRVHPANLPGASVGPHPEQLDPGHPGPLDNQVTIPFV